MRAIKFIGTRLATVERRKVSGLNIQFCRHSLCTSAQPAQTDDLKSVVLEAVSPPTRTGLNDALTPKEVVAQLDKFIVGQSPAKRSVAIALRNRWRRHNLSENFRNEVIPKNILMIGPTGCGKTEIARRIAKLSQAPFIKVEATKFTEVGFHGKDVDHIIKDLLDISIAMTRKKLKEELKADIADAVDKRILNLLIGQNASKHDFDTFAGLMKTGDLEGTAIEIDVPQRPINLGNISMDPSAGNVVFGNELNKLFKSSMKKSTEKKSTTVADARIIFESEEMEKVLDEATIIKEAIKVVEESGIVFIDEIDKLVNGGDYRGADASSEGVQRDLLPLIEGSVISTKHGNVNTDFILFIASGAFHAVKPSDLLAELQGRLPIRVTLKGLTEDDLYRILTEPVTNLIQQQIELLKAENVSLSFDDGAIREIAKVAFETNQTVENIGARRLHTVIEKIMEEISFDAPDKAGQNYMVSQEYVLERVKDLRGNTDLKKYIL